MSFTKWPPDNNFGNLPVRRYFTKNGNPGGQINANEDYSSDPQEWYLIPPDGEYMLIDSITINIVDDSAIVPSGYGGISALTNGIKMFVATIVDSEETVYMELIDGQSIKAAYEWGNVCDSPIDGLTFDSIIASTTYLKFTMRFKQPLAIGSTNDSPRWITIQLNDDFSGLVNHTFFATGISNMGYM